jgi:hypothetical protein
MKARGYDAGLLSLTFNFLVAFQFFTLSPSTSFAMHYGGRIARS